jgi:hypothetical protein
VFREQCEQEQDRYRASRVLGNRLSPRTIVPPLRLFFVEPEGHIYLGEVKPENECPHHLRMGGACYGIDTFFLREVQEFTARHERYMVIFTMKKDYSPYAGIYPARMVSDTEEILLEEPSHLDNSS